MEARSRNRLFLAGCTALGLAAGFGLGFYAASRGSPIPGAGSVQEYVGEARHVNFGTDASEFDVYYPAAYVDPPEPTILTQDMNHGSVYPLADPRRDGRRLRT